MSDNPWDVLDGQKVPDNDDSFGATLQIEARFCVLQKGIGKVPFDPEMHDIKERRVSLRMIVTTNRGGEIVREFLPWDAGWKQFEQSVERLGEVPRYFEQPRRVRVRIVDVLDQRGEPITYTTHEGQVRTRTTIEVVALLDGRKVVDESAPVPDRTGPQDATERVAFAWLREAATRAAVGATPEDLLKALGPMTRKPAMRAITQARWKDLALLALHESGHIPF